MSDVSIADQKVENRIRRCVVVTCFSETQPGYLDFSYRIKSLAREYKLTVLSQDQLTQPELMVPNADYQSMGRRSGKLGWLGYLMRCSIYVRKHEPDAIVLLHSSASPMTLLVGNVPAGLYWNEHPTNLIHLPDGYSPIRYLLAKASHQLVFLGARHADIVMPIGEEHHEDLLAHGCKPERVKLTYMGVGDDFLGAAANRRVSEAEPLELVYIGTVSVARGRDVMLEGLSEAVRRGHKVNLTIVGAGDDQAKYCEQRISELGLDGHLRVVGRVPGSEIPALLANADLGICLWEDKPWWRFNPPTKLFEYLVAGLPVLASNIRTHTRYIQNWNNGLIFEYGVAGFADAIEVLISHRDRSREMKHCAAQSGQHYLWSKIEPAFLQYMAGLVRT